MKSERNHLREQEQKEREFEMAYEVKKQMAPRKDWIAELAADDRLWNTQEMVEKNLRAAIDKATGVKTTEYAKGWDDHVAASKETIADLRRQLEELKLQNETQAEGFRK